MVRNTRTGSHIVNRKSARQTARQSTRSGPRTRTPTVAERSLDLSASPGLKVVVALLHQRACRRGHRRHHCEKGTGRTTDAQGVKRGPTLGSRTSQKRGNQTRRPGSRNTRQDTATAAWKRGTERSRALLRSSCAMRALIMRSVDTRPNAAPHSAARTDNSMQPIGQSGPGQHCNPSNDTRAIKVVKAGSGCASGFSAVTLEDEREEPREGPGTRRGHQWVLRTLGQPAHKPGSARVKRGQ